MKWTKWRRGGWMVPRKQVEDEMAEKKKKGKAMELKQSAGKTKG